MNYSKKLNCLLLVLCPLLAEAMTIDGHLNEAAWKNAQTVSAFFTVDPFTLNSPEYKTEALLFSDESGIYIGIYNHQPANLQRSERVQRDGNMEGDLNEVIIDFDNTGTSAYGFILANGGSIGDGIWRDENQYSADWDGNWQSATRTDDDAWYSEIFIPWDVAPMAQVDGDLRKVGLYLSRRVAHLDKRYANSHTDNDRTRFISTFSTSELDNHSTASLKVFVSATAHADRLQKEESIDANLDIFWKPDSSKQLSLTLNPDFGQVESDSLVVNFSPEETFFNEKRPFFTENQSLFDLQGPRDLRVIHTRRIGAQADAGDAEISDIDAALKFTSNGQGLSYGAFAVKEHNERDVLGKKFYAARASANFNTVRVGLLETLVSRPELDREARSHSLDYDIFVSDKTKIRGQLIQSDIDDPLLDENRLEAKDEAAWFAVEQQLSDHYDHQIEASHYGENFEINDFGFLPRNNLDSLRYRSNWRKPEYTESSRLKSRWLQSTFDHYRSASTGDNLFSYLDIYDHWEFKNTALLRLNLAARSAGHDDRITRGNNILNTDAGYRFGYRWVAPSRKALRYHHMVDWIDMPIEGRGYHLHFHPTYYFSDELSTELSLRYNTRENWTIWRQDNELSAYTWRQFEVHLNINSQLTEKQEVRLKFEWLSLNANNGQDLRLLNNGELEAGMGVAEDFSISSTAIQIRYKYQLGPLSNIFVVYSRGGLTELDRSEGVFTLFPDAWENRIGDNFLVKIRYEL